MCIRDSPGGVFPEGFVKSAVQRKFAGSAAAYINRRLEIDGRNGDVDLAHGITSFPVSYTHLDVYKRQVPPLIPIKIAAFQIKS